MGTRQEPDATPADAESVVRKLEALWEGGTPGERQVLDRAFAVLAGRARQPDVQELFREFPDAPDLLEDVAGYTLTAPREPTAATITTITTITTRFPLCDFGPPPRH